MVSRRKLVGAGLGAGFGLLLFGAWWGGSDLLLWAISDTEYSPGYSEAGFDVVREGMTEAEVVRLLGPPLDHWKHAPAVVRWYGPPGSTIGEDGGLHVAGPDGSKSGVVTFDPTGRSAVDGPMRGATAEEVRAAWGEPIREEAQLSVVLWRYTRSDGHYYRRMVGFDAAGRVAEKRAYFYWD